MRARPMRGGCCREGRWTLTSWCMVGREKAADGRARIPIRLPRVSSRWRRPSQIFSSSPWVRAGRQHAARSQGGRGRSAGRGGRTEPEPRKLCRAIAALKGLLAPIVVRAANAKPASLHSKPSISSLRPSQREAGPVMRQRAPESRTRDPASASPQRRHSADAQMASHS